jgi:hypothetical protein
MVTAGTGYLQCCVRHGQDISGKTHPAVRLRSSAGTVKVVAGVEDAAFLAETWLARALPRRWQHVQSMAQRAAWAGDRLSLPDELVTSAWLHDIGYAPELAVTGFHPIDGARFLRRAGADGQVVGLVAYHSCAQIEADIRGLASALAAEFAPADPVLADVLLWCDMTTGPDGDHVRPADRLAEIRRRYGPGHQVTQFADLAAPEILAAAGRVETMLAADPAEDLGGWP